MDRQTHILHLSDLHFGTLGDAHDWFAALSHDLEQELKCTRLDAVVISGDIARTAGEEQYKAAGAFTTMLGERFAIDTRNIVLAPGNHDVNWERSKNSYEFVWEDDYEGKCDPEKSIGCGEPGMLIRDEKAYSARFDHFASFYESIRKQRYPRQYVNQGIVYEFPKHTLLMLCLNSAWNVDHHYSDRANIMKIAVSNALIKVHSRHEDWMKIAVWHHPLQSHGEDRIKDHDFLQMLSQAGFRVVMHGHVHGGDKDLFHYDVGDDESKLRVIAAGTSGAGTRDISPDYPWHYNFITIRGNVLRVHSRSRTEQQASWGPDPRWKQGSDGEPASFYELTW